MNRLTVKNLCLLLLAGTLLSMGAVTAGLYLRTGDRLLLFCGGVLTACALFWQLLLSRLFAGQLAGFTGRLCRTLDSMMNGEAEVEETAGGELLFDRISHRLSRLYRVMGEGRRRVDAERRELQSLVSDISHQVRTPVSNLRVITDTLLSKPVPEAERREFLRGLRAQTDKLDFLVQALVKTSRLETGVISLEKKDAPLAETLAQALGAVVYQAEQKKIDITVDCPEDIRLAHDAKWTAEALFNLLDNAVKYTPSGGRVRVSAERWEMYVKLNVADTGRGIPEGEQAAVFRRFYREEAVHGEPGVGIGLYLAREIVTRQGGYIRLTSAPGQGSVFSVFLPYR